MDNLEKQIQEFWENQTTPEQRHEILRQLEGSGLEWKEFLQQYYNKLLAGEEASSFSEEQKRKVWQRLQDLHLSANNTGANTPGANISDADHPGAKEIQLPRRAKNYLPWMAAACFITLISLCIYQLNRKSAKEEPSIASQPIKPAIITKKNTGAGEETLTLPDHSEVILSPGSAIAYQQNFETKTRNIRLEGRALFEVAKDSGRPFTVTAHGFATTALGTRFIVDATKPVVSIRLLKGKVVVNATADAGFAMQKMFLVPGQELRINTTTKQFDRLTLDNRPSRSKLVTGDSGTTAALAFERTSLPAVFQRLSAYYKTPILFDKAEVQGLSFTGAFEPSDELNLALKVICNMNQLTFTTQNDHIVISKQ